MKQKGKNVEDEIQIIERENFKFKDIEKNLTTKDTFYKLLYFKKKDHKPLWKSKQNMFYWTVFSLCLLFIVFNPQLSKQFNYPEVLLCLIWFCFFVLLLISMPLQRSLNNHTSFSTVIAFIIIYQNLSLKIHRGLSWFDRFEKDRDDIDSQFIFLWISFNSVYATEMQNIKQNSEKLIFNHFFKKICRLDENGFFHNLIMKDYFSETKKLIDNKYVYQPFWTFINTQTENNWENQFNKQAIDALSQRDTPKLLSIIFNRLYTLRNQLLHGGSTWNSKANREQLVEAVSFLKKMIPGIFIIMMDNHKELWDDPFYPFLNNN